MIEYNYSSEIWTNIAHFISAFDDTVIKRYDEKTGRAVDTIKVGYVFGPKQRILADLQNSTDAITIPAVAVTTTGSGRDNDRIKNKHEEISYKDETGNWVNLKAIPFNINLQLTFIAKYQSDIDQLLTNFIVLSDPYFVYSWKEPKSGKEVRTPVEWDGQVAYNYPTHGGDMNPDQKWRLEATVNFTIKTHLYRTAIENSRAICTVNLDVIPVNNFYCDFETLSSVYANQQKDSFQITGVPQLKWVDDYYFKVGDTPRIRIEGDGFAGTYGLFLSGSNPEMYPLTRYYPTSGSAEYFDGYAVSEFDIPNTREISFNLPAPSAFGFCDVIAVNKCGWSKLTEDANRCNRVLNPYPTSLPEHYSWCVEQYPYLNGLIISNNLNTHDVVDCETDIIVVETDVIDRDAILTKIRELMELADLTVDDI